MKIYCVYLVRRLDGTPCYVGMGTKRRAFRDLKRHAGNCHLSRIAKLADVPLPVEIVYSDLCKEEAFYLEIELIGQLGRRDAGGPLVNFTQGGEGVVNPSVETRKKQSKSQKKRFKDPEQRALTVRAIRSAWDSPDGRKRMCAARKRQWADPEQ